MSSVISFFCSTTSSNIFLSSSLLTLNTNILSHNRLNSLGTLKQLGEEQDRIIRGSPFNIAKRTYMPSTYGNSRRTDFPTIICESQHSPAEYADQICKNILQGQGKDRLRAVIVFFESIEALKTFVALPNVKSSLNLPHVGIYTESQPEKDQNRKDVLDNAVLAGHITFMTKAFGRGTDFYCPDQRVKDAGGVHVIQTFLSPSIAEEVQIQGRTARQSNRGSYIKIIDENSLDKFGFQIPRDTVNLRAATPYDRDKSLHEKRCKEFEVEYNRSLRGLKDLKVEHANSQRFLEFLHGNNQREVLSDLLKKNKGLELIEDPDRISRTLILMDATGSMSGLLSNAKSVVLKVFERVHKVQADLNMKKPFEFQFAAYRNYDAPPDKLLEFSEWKSDANYFQRYLSGIEADYGLGNEAIEIGFYHANNENKKQPISQIILIGDMPPNSPGEVVSKRQRYHGGEPFWGSKFPVTNHEKELRQITAAKIPVHAFFIDECAREGFEAISRVANLPTITPEKPEGLCQSQFLNVNDEESGANFVVQMFGKNYSERRGWGSCSG